ncbi:unnamed protein product [Rangifer tarandus platyrhynchus]|uniref:Uncharacterized protein n=2 Tax=Rangifer tarandus platyrhynchus TaxID=3082113 RepID=A0ABN8ZQT2_RANTA|nr:unnamed protein product [Rangifer tarandus platyrhynchus]CAI9711068.1 unnamed protein product [Rangifer tarandus platyrhynchus]
MPSNPHPTSLPILVPSTSSPGRPTTISKGSRLSSQGSFPATSASSQKMATVHEGDPADSPIARMGPQNCSQPRLEPRVTFRPDVLLSEWYQSAARAAHRKAAIAAAPRFTCGQTNGPAPPLAGAAVGHAHKQPAVNEGPLMR